jgi:hypothetical protein
MKIKIQILLLPLLLALPGGVRNGTTNNKKPEDL